MAYAEFTELPVNQMTYHKDYAVNGSKAIYLARLIALFAFRWQPAQLPLRLREYILPRFVNSFCRVPMSL